MKTGCPMTEKSVTRIGEYEVLSLLGDGARGKVFKVLCAGERPGVARSEIAALKVVSLASGREGGNEDFIRQAEALRSLSHPAIVRYRDAFCWTGEWDESGCLVTDFLEGETLAARIRRSGQGLPWEEAKPVIDQCLEALIYANQQKIAHRDIKPSNIFITREGRAKLIDFDIVSRTAKQRAGTAGWKATFDYLAPEFATDDEFGGDEVSDIFSMAVVIYETLTGESPFPRLEGNAAAQYTERWRGHEPPRPSFYHGSFRVLSAACREFLARGLEHDRNKRFRSFEEMREAFKRVQARSIKASGDYELLAFLGKGGFGEVYKARRVKDNATVAVKYLYSSVQPERFEREARALRKSSHKHIVRYIDFAQSDEVPGMTHSFIIMEFLEGMPGWSLRNRLFNAPNGLPTPEALCLFSHYLDAIQHLHSRKLIHRDIKPANLYAPEGRPDDARIFDLGVAKDVSGTATSGQIPGTLDYMAPEFAMGHGERGSERSDLYSVGLSFYEALTGKPAFPRLPRKGNEALMEFIKRATNTSPPEVDWNCHPFREYPALVDVLQKALARDPAQRFKSAGDMKKAVDRVLAGVQSAAGGEAGAAPCHEAETRALAGMISSGKNFAHSVYRRGQTILRRKPVPAPVSESLSMDGDSSAQSLVADEAARRQRKLVLRVIAGLTVALGVLALLLALGRDMPRGRARARMQQVADAAQAPKPSKAFVMMLKKAVDDAEKWRARDISHMAEWDLWITSARKSAATVPAIMARAFDDTLTADDKPAAQALAGEWEGLSGVAEFMGMRDAEYEIMRQSLKERLERFDLFVSVRKMDAGIPVTISAASLRQAEDVARRYVELLDRLDAAGDRRLRDGLRGIADTLSRSAAVYVAGLKDSTITGYGLSRESGDRRLAELEAFEKMAPSLVNLVRRQYDTAVESAHRARQSTQ